MVFKFVQLLIPVLMILFGFFQTFIYLKLRKTFSNWPVVVGEITHSRLLNQLDLNGKNVTEAIIAFNYKFKGKMYKSEMPVLRGYDLFPSLEYETYLTKKYRPGDVVEVRVNPKVNEFACLEVAPFSRLSAILVPLMPILGIALIVLLKNNYFSELYEYLLLQYDLAMYKAQNI
ncbi:DUF3592 domain-containing protein [Microbulbifer sp. JMSA008]|uniref:DUF3592 domain-containing protein n=1 Tax=Microbulbifer sp. JMSA008 TaxID=3243373 RepID=UPI0040390CFE